MAQVTLKEFANKLGKSTLDALQFVRSQNISYERREGNIFVDDATQPGNNPTKLEIVLEDIPEIFPLCGTDIIIPEIKRRKIIGQRRTDRIRVWMDYDVKDSIERKFGVTYSKDKNYVAIPIAVDLAKACQKDMLESLLNSLLPDKDGTDNKLVKDAALRYAALSLEEKRKTRDILKRNQRLINTAYELRNDVDRFSLAAFLEHERRPLVDSLQDFYRSFLEAILAYQRITPELREEIFRLHTSSFNDYEFALALSQETFDFMRGAVDRQSSNKSLLNTVAFVLKDENSNVDLVEKTRSLEGAHISLENMLDYRANNSDAFNVFVQEILEKVSLATTDAFNPAVFVKETMADFFSKWKKYYGNNALPYGLFMKFMVGALYVADKKEQARSLANNFDNESADQLNYIISLNGKTCVYDLLSQKDLHEATSELIRHWESYRKILIFQGCTKVRSRRYPPDQATLSFLKDIVDQIEYKEAPRDLEEKIRVTEPTPNFLGLYDYPNKRAWRQKWLEFIVKHVRENNINPKDLKVLCLPGPEALEIKEVYDRLGIPRENVHGVEINKKRFEYLQTQAQGARLFNEDILSYLVKTNEAFGIVMLDMDGFLDKHIFQAMQKLFSRSIVKNNALFGTNFFTTREGEEQQEFYSKPLQAELAELLTEDEMHDWNQPEVVKQALGCEYNGVHIDSLRKLRDYGITGMIVKTLLGRQLTEINPAYSLLPENQRCSNAEKMLETNGLLKTLMYNDHMRSHLQSFLRQVGLAELTPVMELYFSRPYFIEHAERYKYETQSAGHVRFYSDFFELNQHNEIFRPFDPLMKRLIDKRKDILQLYGSETPKRDKRIRRLMDGVEHFRGQIQPLHYKFTVTNGWLPERLELKGAS